jgi:peptidoglycan/LPS O-acetylase OafA/YrhL
MDDVRPQVVVAGDGTATRQLPRGFVGVQALRAVAALLVVAMHADEMWHLRLDPKHAEDFWRTGAAGVDIFFVISGFVMMVSARHLAPLRDWRGFAWRRFVRIVPLYWITTTLKIVSVLAFPALVLRTVLRPGDIVASYLFLPWHNAEGKIGTILPVGWTLNVEMGFYILFAAALASGWGLLRVILPCLAVASAISVFVTPDWPAIALYCDPIVLEFGAGLCLGELVLRGRRLPTAPAAIALVAGFALLLVVPPVLPRVLSWGVPAALIVAGTIGLEGWFRRTLPRWLMMLGDASYSIYLTHAFVLAALGAVLQRVALPLAGSFAIAVGLGCVLSAAVGIVCRLVLEAPVLAIFKRLDRA